MLMLLPGSNSKKFLLQFEANTPVVGKPINDAALLRHDLGANALEFANVLADIASERATAVLLRPPVSTYLTAASRNSLVYFLSVTVFINPPKGQIYRLRGVRFWEPVHTRLIAAKDIWLYPLRKDFGAMLCQVPRIHRVSTARGRQAVEPIIGHLKEDHRMGRCRLKGEEGNRLHAVLCSAGYNIRWLLRMIAKKGPFCALSKWLRNRRFSAG